jgi:hypothetical protein
VEGTAVTEDSMRALIDRADHDKWKKVNDRLGAIRRAAVYHQVVVQCEE